MIEAGLLVALIVMAAGFLVLLDRKDGRAHTEREAHRQEVAELCQRVQAPQVAVASHAAEQVQETRTAVPMTDDQIAEREAALAAISDFERRLL